MIVTPVWNGEDIIVCSSAGQNPIGRAIRLTRQDDKTVPKGLWLSQKIRFGQPTPVRFGEYLIGATRNLVMAVEFSTGKRVWGHRGFPHATCVLGRGKFIMLDSSGQLGLATVTPTGLTVHSQCQVTERYSFTAPTLVGKTLYLRDRKHIMALDVG